MKVLAIQGSPRKNGSTSTLMQCYLQGVEKSYHNAEIEIIHVAEKNIQSCTGCLGCKSAQRKCVIDDDMQEIYQSILKAEVLVLASPIYWWNITAQAKQLVDRLYALNYDQQFKGKKLVLLLTYVGEEPNSGTEIIKTMFQEICDYLEMDLTQVYGVCTGTVAVNENYQAQDNARDLGKAL